MKQFEKIIAVGMLIFAIGFNLWLYRLEPSATIDPNDNAFQFALVDRTNQVWDFASKKCSGNLLTYPICFSSYLVDHWVPNWAEGYNLPFYYSHVPQILIVGSWRFVNGYIGQMGLFQYYHWVIYLLLCLFPLTVFLSLRLIRLPWLIAGLGVLLASHLSTDGLYGLDPPSFLWRGFGLSSQLFGMVFFPLAIAYAWRFFDQSTKSKTFGISGLWPAALTIILTAMGHLGLGIMAMLSLVPLAFARPILMILHQESLSHIYEVTKNQLTKLLFLSGTAIFFLSYWVVPIFLADNYHNISFWDPPWKFASYGALETITRLFNGDLFDWGRAPWMTGLVIVGLVGAAWTNFPVALLFIFWLLMYFGRGTWGPLIDLIPGMKEFHLSRFIVGVHVAGLFLMPMGIQWFIQLIGSVGQRVRGSIFVQLNKLSRVGLLDYLIIGLLMVIFLPPIYKQTIEYAKHNDRLILQSIESHAKVKSDEMALFAAIRALPPGRVYAGRGGGFGKDFRVSETPYYMDLSTYGIPSVLWLPETWSPNSDVEQYFNENNARDYDLFGIRYVAAPPKQEPKKFWKLLKEAPTWKLYEIELTPQETRNKRQETKNSNGVKYFTTGVRPAVVATDKRSYGNVVRFWIQSDAHEKGLYPELTFAKDYPRIKGLPNFKILDEVTYMTPDTSTHNLFAEPPVYFPPGWETINTTNHPILPIIKSEINDGDMIFSAKFDVPDNCTECIVVLKQSFHPNWRATIDGKPAATFTVFPFYLATLVPAGSHEVVFSYEPSRLKVFLLSIEAIIIIAILGISLYGRLRESTGK